MKTRDLYLVAPSYAGEVKPWMRRNSTIVPNRIQCKWWGARECAHCNVKLPEDCLGNCARCRIWTCPCMSGKKGG